MASSIENANLPAARDQGPDLEMDWRALTRNLRGFFHRRVPAELVDDLTQATLVKLVEHLGDLQDATRIEAWIYQIARRVTIDYYRAREGVPLPLDFDLADDSSLGEPAAPIGELAECVRPMLAALEEPYRRALKLADLEGLGHAQIAAREGISIPGLRSRLARGRAKLRKRFEDCCRLARNEAGQIATVHERSGCSDC